jgi:hypothetical protein
MKKKILLSLAVIVSSVFSLKAQIDKGDWILGGSFGLNSANSNSNYSTSNANFAPNIGLAIGRNSVIGLGFGLAYSSNSVQQSFLSFSSSVFYKKYFIIKNKLGYYLQLHGGILFETNKFNAIDSSGNTSKIRYKSYVYNVGITPGIYYEVAPRILLTADVGGLGYAYSNGGSGNWSSNFNLSFLNSFTFGVDFVLGKKQAN